VKTGNLSDDLVHVVDIINLDQAPRWFLAKIDYEPVLLDGDVESFIHFQGVLDGTKRSDQGV